MAREADVWGVTTGNFAVPGGTVLLMRGVPFQVGVQFQYVSGGSLAFFGVPAGITAGSLTDAQWQAGASNAYLMPTTQVQTFQGPTWFAFVATGTTAVVSVCRLLSAGFSTSSP